MSFATVSYSLNVIGMVSSSVCLLLFIFLASRNIKYVNRITFKLQAASALVDFLFHLFVIIPWNGTTPKLCSFYAFMIMYLNSTYYCIFFVITLNLHLNVLYSNKLKPSFVKYLWAAIVIFPIVHTVPLYALDMLGLGNNGKCYVTGSGLKYKIAILTNVLLPITIVFLYCTIVTSIIFIKTLRSDSIVRNMIAVHQIQNEASKVLLKKLLNTWILRIMLYPIAFCLIHCGRLVDFIAQFIYNKPNKALFYWAISGCYLSGFFNLIAFICDPYFQSAIKIIFNRVLENNDCFGESLNFPGEPPRYEMEVQSLASKDSRAADLRKTPTLRRRYYNNDQETDSLLRDMTKNL